MNFQEVEHCVYKFMGSVSRSVGKQLPSLSEYLNFQRSILLLMMITKQIDQCMLPFKGIKMLTQKPLDNTKL